MMRRVLVMLAAALVSFSTGVGPVRAVTGGSLVGASTWNFLAKVNVGAVGGCSGALVSPQWVITASSCFSVNGQPVSTGTPRTATTVTVGRADLSGSAGRVLPAVQVVPHPTRDVALVKLSLRITDIAPITVGGTAPVAGEPLRLAGYGRTETEWVPNRVRAASALVGAVTGASFSWTEPAGVEATACQGDAGGPVFRIGGTQPDLVGINVAAGQGGCLDAPEGNPRGATAARVDDLGAWIRRNATEPTTGFRAYHNSAEGIGGYDLAHPQDQIVPFDYDHSGKLDHLLLYRPGSGAVWIVKHNANDTYQQVYGKTGIGGYDITSVADRIVPFDYEHSGKLDHLLLYRPGSGKVAILKHGSGNTFTAVYSADTGGIGGYDLGSPADQVMAFDYEHSGKLDHLLLYRPGTGLVRILKHGAGNTFSPVFQSTTGFPNFDLSNPDDRIVAFDYDRSGKPDHLVLYRPGWNSAVVVRHDTGTTFTAVYTSYTAGIGGFDLASPRDRVLAYDYERTGKLDHLVLYRPGAERAVWIVKRGTGNSFGAVYHSEAGIGGYDLASTADRIVAFDDDHSGGPGHLVLYRPNSRIVWVVGRNEPAAAAPVTAQPASGPDSIVERFSYPGAAEILDSLNVRLISGDGHILLADCATPPVNNVGVIKVYTTEQIGPNGAGMLCFKVNGPVGRLDLEVPGVFEIRGDGQQPGFGHQLTAVVTTEGGAPTPVAVNPSGSTQVGIGADPNNEPTTLLQLRIPS